MRVPIYRHHKARNLAVVRLDGRDVYLGPFDSPESHQKYRQVIAEWLAGKPSAQPANDGATVSEIVLRFLDAHKNYYIREDGNQTGELANFVDAFRPLKNLYGREHASEFGPLKLEAVRQEMIRGGLARTTVNARVRRIIQVFKWAASEELVPPSVHHGLRTVSGTTPDAASSRPPGSLLNAFRHHRGRHGS